jgi:thioredoxin 2
VPDDRIQDHPICAKCKTPLPAAAAAGSPVTVTDQTFQPEVLDHAGPVLLDCWAPWCGPCKMVSPILDQLARAYAGRVKIAKLNVDQNPLTSSRYQILSIPSLLFFKNGQLVKSLTGARPQPEIERELQILMNR